MTDPRTMAFAAVLLARANAPTSKEKRLARRARATKCWNCGADIPPGRPGRECKECREGGRRNLLLEQG